jgi:hypothetical protein
VLEIFTNCQPSHLLNTVMPGWSCSGMREPGGNWKMPMVMVGSSCMSKYVTVPLKEHSQTRGTAQAATPNLSQHFARGQCTEDMQCCRQLHS